MHAQRQQPVRLLTVCLVAIAFAVTLWALPNGRTSAAIVGTVGLGGSALGFAVLAVRRARRSSEPLGRGWTLLGAGGVAFAAGQGAWAIQQLAGDEVPYPSWAEAFYLAQYPLSAAGILLLTSGATLPASSRARLAVDGLLVASALLVLAWDTTLEPMYEAQADAGTASLVVGLAHPLAHIVLLTLILTVANVDRSEDHVLGFLAAGFAASAAAYATFGWLTLEGDYFTGHVIDAGWVLAFGLMAVAASQRLRLPRTERGATSGRRERAGTFRDRLTLVSAGGPVVAAMPIGLTALAMTGLVVQLLLAGGPERSHVWLAGAVVTLLLTRQWLLLRENTALTRRLEDRVAARNAELSESHRRYESVLDSIQEVVFQADERGCVTFASRAWQALTGEPPTEAVGKRLIDLVRAEDVPSMSDALDRVINHGVPARLDCGIAHRAGHTRRVEVTMQVGGADREVRAISGSIRDVTARRRAEEALRDSEERWRLLLEFSSEGIMGMDRDGHATFLNPAATAMLQLDPEQVLGEPVHELIHHSRPDGTPYPAHECALVDVIRSGQSHHLAEETLWRRDGTSFPAEVNAQPLLRNGVVTGSVVTFTDITRRKAADREIRHRALHDSLTELPNRRLLADRLEQAIATGDRDRHPSGLMVLDLDDFKDVNDRFGHHVGDQVLRETADRLRGTGLLRSRDTVARLGGDEFAVVLPDAHTEQDIETVAQKLLRAVTAPMKTTAGVVQVGCSIGLAVAPDDGRDAQLLLQRADLAMYMAKAGGGGIARYSAGQDRARVERLELVGELRDAIQSGGLQLQYQPIVDLSTGALSHVEALCRWHRDLEKPVTPDVFIALAQDAGMMLDLTAAVFAEACRQSTRWQRQGFRPRIAINVSPSTLHTPELVDLVRDWNSDGDRRGQLEIEVTENAVMDHPQLAFEQLQRLRALGVRVAVDDFGTGYSSLAQLRDMPVHSVKIDRSFLSGAPIIEQPNLSIVQAIIVLAHSLDLTVVAEGVETPETAVDLRSLGCDKAQGWHFGRPESGDRLLTHSFSNAPAN